MMDDVESFLRCMTGACGGIAVDFVSKEDELSSSSGLGPDLGEGFAEFAVASPLRDASESLRLFACVEGVSPPESEGGGEDGKLLGCGSILSRGGRK